MSSKRFFGRFVVSADLDAPAAIAAAFPLFEAQYITFMPEPSSTKMFASFDTWTRAWQFKAWLEHAYSPAGTRFLDRPLLLLRDCHVWERLARWEDLSPRPVHAMRTERLYIPALSGPQLRWLLHDRFLDIQAEAIDRGYTAAWLLYSEAEQLVSLVYSASDADEPHGEPPLLGLLRLTSDEATVNHSPWIPSIWSPFMSGRQREYAVWPYTPTWPL